MIAAAGSETTRSEKVSPLRETYRCVEIAGAARLLVSPLFEITYQRPHLKGGIAVQRRHGHDEMKSTADERKE